MRREEPPGRLWGNAFRYEEADRQAQAVRAWLRKAAAVPYPDGELEEARKAAALQLRHIEGIIEERKSRLHARGFLV